MKGIGLLLIASCYLLQVKQETVPLVSYSKTDANPSVVGMFAGRTPCQDLAKDLKKEVGSDCFKLKWAVTLYQDPETHKPTTYKMEGTFYRKAVREGTWTIVKGTKAIPEAVVYRLDSATEPSLFLYKADENVLFFLDNTMGVRVGNEEFSYTLDRVMK